MGERQQPATNRKDAERMTELLKRETNLPPEVASRLVGVSHPVPVVAEKPQK